MCRLSLVLAFFTAAGFRIQAQDALLNALSLDPALASKENPLMEAPTNQPHLGPVQFTLSTYLAATFDDNITESGVSPLSDVILRPGLDISLFWLATERSALQFSTDISYLQYVKQTQYSGLQVSPNSALTYSVSFADATLSFYDQLNYWRQVTTESALANIATLPRLDNTIGTRFSWAPGRWLVQLGYGYETFLSENAANNYLDRSTQNLFARLGWRLAEQSETGLEASGGLTSYRVHIQSDNDSVSLGPYAEWQLRPAIHLTLRGGPTFYYFQPSSAGQPGGNLNSYYLGASISHQLTDFLAYQFNLRRDVQLGLNEGSNYIEQWTGNFSLTWAMTQRINLTASLTYENGTQPLPVAVLGPYVFEASEHFERVGGGPQIAWRFTDKLTTSLTYYYWQRNSNLPGRGYNENIVSVSLSYAF
jgi:hypothetical protein